MREIKFRAWDGYKKRMINKGFWDRNWYTHENKCICPMLPEDRSSLELMQYTGLKDKNGVEIYEGDIIASPHFEDLDSTQHYLFHIVEWSEKYLGWFLLSANSKNPNDGSIQLFVGVRCASQQEVIGNIHENKDLIK